MGRLADYISSIEQKRNARIERQLQPIYQQMEQIANMKEVKERKTKKYNWLTEKADQYGVEIPTDTDIDYSDPNNTEYLESYINEQKALNDKVNHYQALGIEQNDDESKEDFIERATKIATKTSNIKPTTFYTTDGTQIIYDYNKTTGKYYDNEGNLVPKSKIAKLTTKQESEDFQIYYNKKTGEKKSFWIQNDGTVVDQFNNAMSSKDFQEQWAESKPTGGKAKKSKVLLEIEDEIRDLETDIVEYRQEIASATIEEETGKKGVFRDKYFHSVDDIMLDINKAQAKIRKKKVQAEKLSVKKEVVEEEPDKETTKNYKDMIFTIDGNNFSYDELYNQFTTSKKYKGKSEEEFIKYLDKEFSK